MSQVGMEHGEISALLVTKLANAVLERKLGRVYTACACFRVNAGLSFSPVAAFLTRERLRGTRPSRKPFQGAPDLAVEILTPTDTVGKISRRLVDYFGNGARLVWVINPADHTVLVYHSPQPDRILKAGDVLDGEQVISGFSLPVVDLFAEYDFETAPLEEAESFDADETDDDEQD